MAKDHLHPKDDDRSNPSEEEQNAETLSANDLDAHVPPGQDPSQSASSDSEEAAEPPSASDNDLTQNADADEVTTPGADSQTLISDEFDEGDDPLATQGMDADIDQTVVTEGEEPQWENPGEQTVLVDATASGDQTLISDEFDEGDDPLATQGLDADIDQTVVTEGEEPPWENAGEQTVQADTTGTSQDSQTLISDEFLESAGPELMAQSDIRQTISPKSMGSEDRKQWEALVRGANDGQGASAVGQHSVLDSSLLGISGHLNIQTRTLVQGQTEQNLPVDYSILRKLGEGGMGAVFLANQTSLNRNVALKVIKPLSEKQSQRLKKSGRFETAQQSRQGQFLTEAVITGDLEHPNIVPIYDVAASQDGTVFYAMKCVVGTPWSEVIRQKSLNDNLDILLKVSDGMAFAHSRGIVHRDLKPENVMLGEFGVVLVMDWGLALTTEKFPKNDSIRRASSLGGSPAYMAPELAIGPINRIGPAADIYLLGAILFEMIVGRPPHSGTNVSQCLKSAASNKIDVPEKHRGELMEIALKAMATRPEDRYASVEEFQSAIRNYLEHAESIGLAARAKGDLAKARGTQQYSDFARSMFGFEEALELWSGNETARMGLAESQLAYAELALEKADYDLGLSLLDREDPAHAPIIKRLEEAQSERDSRQNRLAWMKRIAAALLVVIFVGGGTALAYINGQKNEIAEARDQAIENEKLAIAAKLEAQQAAEAEKKAKEAAIALRLKAEQAAEQERLAKEAALAAQLAERKAREEADQERMKALRAAQEEMKAKIAAQQAAEAEKKAKNEAIALRVKAEKAAEAEKKAKDEAIAQKLKAEKAAEAEKKAKLLAQQAAEAEKKAKNEAIALRIKAEKAAEAEKKAKDEAIAQKLKAEKAAEAEKKAKLLAQKAAEAEKKAKDEAVAQRLKAEKAAEAEKKAKLAAIKAAEEEKKAKLLAQQAAEAEKKAKLEAIAAKDAETKAKNQAIALRLKAEKAAVAERKAKELAVAAKEAETKAKNLAIAAKEAETIAKQQAIEAKRQAIYEAYMAKIGLAKARIDQNEFDSARTLLRQLKSDPETATLCGWEWSRLMYQANQSAADVPTKEAVRDVTMNQSGRLGVIALDSGLARLVSLQDDGELAVEEERPFFHGSLISSAAISPDGLLIATAGEDGDIAIWDSQSGIEAARLTGHRKTITRVRFLDTNRLVSASEDATVRIWDVRQGKELAQVWHIAGVQDVAFSAEEQPLIASAVADARAGRVVLWRMTSSGETVTLQQVGDFTGHATSVFSVAVSPRGDRIASGDRLGRLLLWQRDSVAPLDYGAAIDQTLNRLAGRPSSSGQAAGSSSQFVSLVDHQAEDFSLRLIGEDATPAHQEAIHALAFSSQGDKLLSASDDFTMKVWDVASGRLDKTLRGHGGWIRAALFDPANDDLILSASYDRSIKTWTLSQYAETVVLDLAENTASSGKRELRAHEDEILSAEFNAAGTRIVTTSRDQTAKILDVQLHNGQLQLSSTALLADEETSGGSRELSEGHRYVAMSMKTLDHGKTLLLGGVDGSIRLFDLERGTELGRLTGCGLNTDFAVSEKGRLVLSSSSESGVSAQLWELTPNSPLPKQPRHKLRGHDHPVTAFAISPDERILFTGDRKGTGIFWDAETGKRIGSTMTIHQGLRINEARFLSNDKLVTASDDQTIALTNVRSGETETTFQNPGFVTRLDVSPDGKRLLSISERNLEGKRETMTELREWDLGSGSYRVLIASVDDGAHTQIRSARYTGDGSLIVTTHGGYESDHNFLRLWKTDSGEEPRIIRTLRFPKRIGPMKTALIPEGRKQSIITLHGNAALRWNLKNLVNDLSYRAHAAVTDGSFSSDGRYVATVSRSIKLWDAETARPLSKLETPHNGAIRSVKFSPRPGSYQFATAGDDGKVYLWNWNPEQRTITKIRSYRTNQEESPILREVAFSADGSYLLAVGDQGTACLWSLDRETPVVQFADPEVAQVDFLCCALKEDGRSVAIGGSDNRIRVFEYSLDEKTDSQPVTPRLRIEGHADRIESVLFLPEPQRPAGGGIAPSRILSASRDRSARVWDAQTGREIFDLRKHSLGLTSIDAVVYKGANGQQSVLVMTAGRDGRVILWPAGP